MKTLRLTETKTFSSGVVVLVTNPTRKNNLTEAQRASSKNAIPKE